MLPTGVANKYLLAVCTGLEISGLCHNNIYDTTLVVCV